MTLPSVVRVFFAIDLPAATKATLGQYIADLKKQSKAHAIRWSRPENLHITLQFLPEVAVQDVPTLIAEVKAVLAGKVESLSFHLGPLHVFPDPYRPRVIVLDVSPQAALMRLSSRIGEGIHQAGYETEEKPFRAHMTIGRIKQPQGINLGFLSTTPAPAVGELTLKDVVLFRSEPQPEGSRYVEIERIILS